MFKPYKYTKKHKSKYIILKFFSRNILVSSFLVTLGVVVLMYKVIVPVGSVYLDKESYVLLVDPVYDNGAVVSNNEFYSNDFQFSELSKYEGENRHFETGDEDIPKHFYLSIPKLGIKDAKIEMNSTNLDPQSSLGHYQGSCLPGDLCNAFFFGHSTFVNPWRKGKDESLDYLSVFSELNKLSYGDEFLIEDKENDKKYRYLVSTTKVQSPDKVDPLEDPSPKGSFRSTATLFTCDPPGTIKNRRSVVGVLVT